jgi:hypothetical protein
MLPMLLLLLLRLDGLVGTSSGWMIGSRLGRL